ncbi:MAG: sulfur carrier protein ThiS [Muribaculaceae bacterium]|nr:sulfur carrier protein ThiS [Muribaculaceae bacterium]
MKIYLNNELIDLPNDYMTVEDLLKWKNISEQGTAVAINDKLLLKKDWPVKNLQDLMRVTVISAAFGG